jgi:hypothetical protein
MLDLLLRLPDLLRSRPDLALSDGNDVLTCFFFTVRADHQRQGDWPVPRVRLRHLRLRAVDAGRHREHERQGA